MLKLELEERQAIWTHVHAELPPVAPRDAEAAAAVGIVKAGRTGLGRTEPGGQRGHHGVGPLRTFSCLGSSEPCPIEFYLEGGGLLAAQGMLERERGGIEEDKVKCYMLRVACYMSNRGKQG